MDQKSEAKNNKNNNNNNNESSTISSINLYDQTFPTTNDETFQDILHNLQTNPFQPQPNQLFTSSSKFISPLNIPTNSSLCINNIKGQYNITDKNNTYEQQKFENKQLESIQQIEKQSEKEQLIKDQYKNRKGIIYYILDNFQDCIRSLNIYNMLLVWETVDRFKLQQLKNFAQENQIIVKLIQAEDNISYADIVKILLILCTKSGCHTEIFSKLGFVLNCVITEKYYQLLKKLEEQKIYQQKQQQQQQIGVELLDFFAHLILNLQSQSLHLYFPIVVQPLHSALQSHLEIISSPLKTIFSITGQSIQDLSAFIMVFLLKAYPLNGHPKILYDHVIYISALIYKLIEFLYYPQQFHNQQSPSDLSQAIINEYFNSSKDLCVQYSI